MNKILSVLCVLGVSLFSGCADSPFRASNPAVSPAPSPIAVVGNDFVQSAVEVLQDYKDYQNGNTGWLYTLEKGLHAYSTIAQTYADARDVLKQFTASKGQPWVDRLLVILEKKPDVPLETKMAALAALSDHVAADHGP